MPVRYVRRSQALVAEVIVPRYAPEPAESAKSFAIMGIPVRISVVTMITKDF